MDILNKLSNLKLITQTQVDLSYISSFLPENSEEIAKLNQDVLFITQIGSQLFNVRTEVNPSTQMVWFEALDMGLKKCISDAEDIMDGDLANNGLNLVLGYFIDNLKKIIPEVVCK